MTHALGTRGLNLADFPREQPIHLAGIAGSAMRGLALVLRERGYKVVGTDPKADEVKERLERVGVAVHQEQDGRHIPKDASLVVATAALPKSHPELIEAKRRGLKIATYAEVLGALVSEGFGIAIAGTHGKTTTAAMVVSILDCADKRPGFVIGADIKGLGSGRDIGKARAFVAEACEFNRSFLNLWPKVAAITNIEADHLEVYGDISAIVEAFGEFAEHLPSDGLLVHSAACQSTRAILARAACPKIAFGFDGKADLRAENILFCGTKTEFDLFFHGEFARRIELEVPGRHNIENALAAIAICRHLEVSFDDIARALAAFQGAARRFDIRGVSGGVVIVDDYAHHPTELLALLDAAKGRFPDRRITIVFQPHQLLRTRFLFKDFVRSFHQADRVIISDIYAARDPIEEQGQVSAAELARQIGLTGVFALYIADLGDVAAYLEQTSKPGDVVITAGAGNVNKVAERLLKSESLAKLS